MLINIIKQIILYYFDLLKHIKLDILIYMNLYLLIVMTHHCFKTSLYREVPSMEPCGIAG